ncbi:MAG: hypothetical protein KAR19_12615 [Bacteroidales bacterium]|nr:hypothetical protein [Bacteroidales bacterium]
MERTGCEPGPFNYYEMVKRMRESIAKRDALNQKRERDKNITDVINLLVYGPAGPNQSVIGAPNGYRALDRFRMLSIDGESKNLQFKLAREAEGRQRAFTREQADIQRAFTAGKRYQDKVYSDKIGYILKGVSITPDLHMKMLMLLQMMYDGFVNKPRALKDIDMNENVQDESIRDLILQHWDDLKKVVPELSAAQSRETMVEISQATNQSQDNSQAYANSIANVMANTEYSYRKKLRLIRDAAMNHNGWDKDKAEQYAKELLKD